jgi:hypothetical protein
MLSLLLDVLIVIHHLACEYSVEAAHVSCCIQHLSPVKNGAELGSVGLRSPECAVNHGPCQKLSLFQTSSEFYRVEFERLLNQFQLLFAFCCVLPLSAAFYRCFLFWQIHIIIRLTAEVIRFHPNPSKPFSAPSS